MQKNKLVEMLKKDIPGGKTIDAANHPKLSGMYFKISLGLFAVVLVLFLVLYDNGTPERNRALLQVVGLMGACCLGIYIRMKLPLKYLKKRYEKDITEKNNGARQGL